MVRVELMRSSCEQNKTAPDSVSSELFGYNLEKLWINYFT